MSDSYLSVVAADPHWRPGDPEPLLDAFARLVPQAEEVVAEQFAGVQLVDCGEDLEHVRCPFCAADLDEWWPEAHEGASQDEFVVDLAVTTPCCRKATSLNDLVYDGPMAYASFEVSAHEPGTTWLTEAQLAALAKVAGTGLRQVSSHL